MRREISTAFGPMIFLVMLLLACVVCGESAGALASEDTLGELPEAPSADGDAGPGTIDQWETMEGLVNHLAYGTQDDPFLAIDPFWAQLFADAQQDYYEQYCEGNSASYQYCTEDQTSGLLYTYTSPELVVFDPPSDIGACGRIESEVTSSYYCPEDQTVYFNFSGSIQDAEEYGLFVFAFTVAHEWGHHVQNQLGYFPYETEDNDVAFENQADCFAGAWAHSAYVQGHFDEGAILEGIDTAYGWGDHLTEEEGKTHGSPEERVEWFRQGFETGDPSQCTTFE